MTYGWLRHARSGEWYAARWNNQGKLVALIGAVTQVERESTDPRDWIDGTVDDGAVLDADWAAGQEWQTDIRV